MRSLASFIAGAVLLLSPSLVSASDHCPEDLDGDGQVRVPDLIMLLAAWGPCEVCGDDVVEGPEECDPPDGVFCDDDCQFIPQDCCFPHPTPGCEDQSCESAVCAVDGFCCNPFWDELCAIGAAELCPECFGLDCCFNHLFAPAAGCTDSDCESIVCDARPACCTDFWDQFCVALADLFCEQCIP